MLRNYAMGFGVLMLLTGCQLGNTGLPEDQAHESTSITKWTTKTELFVDFTPLVAGKAIPFAVHLTDLETAQAVSGDCLLYTSPSPRDGLLSRMPSSA